MVVLFQPRQPAFEATRRGSVRLEFQTECPPSKFQQLFKNTQVATSKPVDFLSRRSMTQPATANPPAAELRMASVYRRTILVYRRLEWKRAGLQVYFGSRAPTRKRKVCFRKPRSVEVATRVEGRGLTKQRPQSRHCHSGSIREVFVCHVKYLSPGVYSCINTRIIK